MLPLLRLVWWLAALVAALGSLSAAADPPARVGRLSLTEDEVGFRLDRRDEAGPASYNWPISSGAILETGPDGRAEVQVGSSVFRLAVNSGVEFTVVDDSRIVLQAFRGSLAATLRDRDQAGEIEIGTSAGQVHFDAPGRYRVDVDEDRGDIRVSSWAGSARVDRPEGRMDIPDRQRAVIYASGGWFLEDFRRDDFDHWTEARDAAGDASVARNYVSPQMTGYEDLDRYGDWGSDPGYGVLWYPRAVPGDWAPYRYGRWAWIQPWGWTWVDEAPWGFAPFHYGRWLFVGGRWAWVPGAYIQRPVYAPALVAWVGNPGLNADFGGSPAVGWFPLAPREVFIPPYRCSPAYVRRANINHVADVAVINRAVADPRSHAPFVNRSLSRAVTVVPANLMRNGSPITSAQVQHLGRHDLARVPGAAGAAAATVPPPIPAPARVESFAVPGAAAVPRGQEGEGAFRHSQRFEGRRPAVTPVQISPPTAGGVATLQRIEGERPAGRPDVRMPPPRAAFPAPAIQQSMPPASRPDVGRLSVPGRFQEHPAPIQVLSQPQALPQPRNLTPAASITAPAVVVPGIEARPASPRAGRHDLGKPPHAR